MKSIQSILVILSLSTILFTSCESEDDSQTEETEVEDSLITGSWNLADVQIVNSLLTNTVTDDSTGFPITTDVEISFSTEVTGTNDYTSTFSEDSNTLINNGSFDLDITTSITYSILGFPTTETETETNTLTGTGVENTWSLNATDNEISFVLPLSTDNITGQVLELTETSLIISTKVEDFLEDSEINSDETLEGFTGDYGDLILTYTK